MEKARRDCDQLVWGGRVIEGFEVGYSVKRWTFADDEL